MTDTAELERAYRRWLRWYPKSFRRAHEAEILAVLLAGVRAGQRQPAAVECLDLLRGALCMRLRPRVPRSDRATFAAVRLMYLGAVVELTAAVTILATIGDVRSNVVERNPRLTEGTWHAVVADQIEPVAMAAGIAVGFWLWMAWAVGRGHRWARIVSAIFFALNAFGLLNRLAQGSAVYARPDLALGIVLCLVELAAVAAVFRVKLAGSPAGTGRINPGSWRRGTGEDVKTPRSNQPSRRACRMTAW